MEGGTSTTLLEAMICGTTIIATAVGGSKETLYHMKNAYVVKPNNPKEIIEGILKMLNDKPKCDELAKNALEQSKKFEWENVGKQYLEIYQKLCK